MQALQGRHTRAMVSINHHLVIHTHHGPNTTHQTPIPNEQPGCRPKDDISFNSGISACEKAGEWQLALYLLSAMAEAHAALSVLWAVETYPCRAYTYTCVGPTSLGTFERSLGFQLQRGNQRLREGRSVAGCPVSPGADDSRKSGARQAPWHGIGLVRAPQKTQKHKDPSNHRRWYLALLLGTRM